MNSALDQLFQWFINHGYFVMFVTMALEGPIATTIAAFAAAFGYFNIFAVAGLSFSADLIRDTLYYTIGYWSRYGFIKKFGRFFRLDSNHFSQFDEMLKSHLIKILFFFKLTPFIAFTGLAAAGAARIPFKKFIVTDILLIVPFTVFFSLLGFYFGVAFTSIFLYYKQFQYFILAILAVAIIAFFVHKKIVQSLSRGEHPND